MEESSAISALAALAHAGRLSAFRLLVRAGPQGLPAGEIARRLGVLPNTLSASLNLLSHAGLVGSRREGRSIVYTAEYRRMSELLAYLMEDCCQGRPEVCGPAVARLASCCSTESEAMAEALPITGKGAP